MSDYGLVPDYTNVDFQTLRERLKKLLSKTETFKDYDFEGANITLIMELLSYIGDLNTFYTNRLAQNIHTETADIYEVVHSLSMQQGYIPSGYVSSEVRVTVTIRQRNDDESVTYFDVNDQLYIPKWFKVDTGLITDDGDNIYYCMAEDFTFDVTVDNLLIGYDPELEQNYNYVEFDVIMKQGIPLQEPLIYTGEDIISNQIVLPFEKYDMGVYPYEETLESLLVTIGDSETAWVRISDFFDDLSGMVDVPNAYIFYYDKYKRAILSFSHTRNIPEYDDTIKIYPIKSLGLDGPIAANTFNNDNKPKTDIILGVTDVPFLTNISTSITIPDHRYTVVNKSASVGGSDPQSIEELKIGGMAYSHSQLRNVTSKDYIGNLSARGDITVANVWGEQEEHPEVLNTTYYNRAYISIIPTEWENGTDNNVSLIEIQVDDEFSNNPPGNPPEELLYPEVFNVDHVYNPLWEQQLLEYLEPRKMLGIWEEFKLPELVYFRFDFGLKVRRSYSWTVVKQDVLDKLKYYFSNINRKFGEVIDFREVYNYIVDPSNVSPDNTFQHVRGIQSLVVRDVLIYRDPSRVEIIDTQEKCEYIGGTWTSGCSIVPDEMYIYNDNIYNYYPHFVDTGYDNNTIDMTYNTIQPIKLGHNQFPQLASSFCIFVNEG